MSEVTYTIENQYALIGFGQGGDKSLTVLSSEALKELGRHVDQVIQDQKKEKLQGVIFFSHRPGVFLAGVDVNIIASLKTESAAEEGARAGQEIYDKIEDLSLPTMVCIDGICLGGGMELSLACDYIVTSKNKSVKLGLPEVKLGVLPGFGGSWRLPRKIGFIKALDLILSGKLVTGKRAYRWGLVDAMVPAERFIELAPQIFKKGKRKQSLKKKLTRWVENSFFARQAVIKKARETILKKTKGVYPAPLRILDLYQNHYSKCREDYLAQEARFFGELSQTPQSQSLQHIFFISDYAKKKSRYPLPPGKDIQRSGVLGAGTMGGGIAWLLANMRQNPVMKDIGIKPLEIGIKRAAKNFKFQLRRKKITREEFERKARSITPVLDYSSMKGLDLVIEAVVEKPEIKQAVFSELEKYVDSEAIIASNTSSLSITELTQNLNHRQRFIGLHFFNPVSRMPLVEIITHENVDQNTVARLYHWVLSAGKIPVVVKDAPGFLVNRILIPYLVEALNLLEEGVDIKLLDKAALNFGMPMGPCRLLDEIGIDVVIKVGRIMCSALGARFFVPDTMTEIESLGALGKKTGKGFYLYNKKGKSTGVNPSTAAVFKGGTRVLSEKDLQMRMFLRMVNEAAHVLDEKIAPDAQTVDVGMVYGTGFPPFLGGPLYYADREGLPRILETLQRYASQVSVERYQPSPFLEQLVAEKRTFYQG